MSDPTQQRHTMRRTTAISALVGALLLVGSPAVWYFSQPATSVGDLEVFDASPTTAVDEPPPAIPPEEPAPQTFTVSEPRGPLVAIARPARIAIPAIGVEAPVVPVALEPDGTMEIPEDVATIGWFEPGVRPGQPGSAVLSGHVDSRTQGRGAFFDLEDLDVGDEVTIETAGGPQRWQVTARQRFAKDELPISELFTREGDPRLILITCGGEFDAGARSYSDNVVIVAVPA
jgi:LPXTG-site transpeptidase (sortase) family protein